ncbi:hypothetical protein IE53DRAFT_384879 [Violaceomyces palustris]|uniref:Uncharacterized protein n=1 Tax=Violaceomyces palustris TaxID=1673888 RepID=A0ACD0P3I7_9BASI|nr:hypothetical protein IE53DRAFT_384879 [Violaceomyces palustris]
MLVPILLLLCTFLAALTCLLCICIYTALYRAPTTTSSSSLGRSAAVVVLGDIGRSPRMCYHVESLANEGWKVAIVGYKGTRPPPALKRSSIKHHHLSTPPAFITKLPRSAFAIVAPFKVLLQSFSLFWELAARVQPSPEVILVQTPPALPTLFVVKLVSILLGSKVIIDWHNLGYTILALRMGDKSALVRLAEHLEKLTGRTAYAHLFVTKAMMNHLDRNWGLVGQKRVLYDRPPSHFRRSTTRETHHLFCSLSKRLSPPLEGFWPDFQLPESTPFTSLSNERRRNSSVINELRPDSPISTSFRQQPYPFSHTQSKLASGSTPRLRDDRPALVVSSTSWTADEDFGLLLRAARIYERRAKELSRRNSAVIMDETTTTTPGSGYNSSNLASPASSLGYPTFETEAPCSPSGSVGSTRLTKERRRPSLGALRTSTLPNEPALSLPKVLIIVTGKGELRSYYEAEVARLEKEENWEWVRIRTVWLESEEYPVLLGSADVGVSLHTSSSGLDLPMKVVDMLGCGLAVCALDFNCLDELVQDGRNGLVFRDAEGLERQLESLLSLHPSPSWLMGSPGMKSPFFDPQEPPTTPNPLLATGPMPIPSNSTTMNSGGNALMTPISRPSSPNPTISLLHSPVLSPSRKPGPSGCKEEGDDPEKMNWTKNWKKVVRPLLNQAGNKPGGRGSILTRGSKGAVTGSERKGSHHHSLLGSDSGGGIDDDDNDYDDDEDQDETRRSSPNQSRNLRNFTRGDVLGAPLDLGPSKLEEASTPSSRSDGGRRDVTPKAKVMRMSHHAAAGGEEDQEPVDEVGYVGGEPDHPLNRLRRRRSIKKGQPGDPPPPPSDGSKRHEENRLPHPVATAEIPHIQVSHAGS